MVAWSYAKVPDLTGKVAVVTGGNTGLGKHTCLELARKGCHVIVCGRNEERTMAAIAEIKKETGNNKVDFLKVDQMDLKSVKRAADTFLERRLPLHILVNNAGIMGVPFALSQDGIESQFATNHFSHFYFTQLLMPRIIESAPARIVNISSLVHTFTKTIDFEALNDQKKYSKYNRYCETKLANVLFTRSLVQKLHDRGIKNVYVNCCHPGVVQTEITRNTKYLDVIANLFARFFLLTPEQGAVSQTFLATDPSIEANNINGEYYSEMAKPGKSSELGYNTEFRDKLWRWTTEVIKEKLGSQYSSEWPI